MQLIEQVFFCHGQLPDLEIARLQQLDVIQFFLLFGFHRLDLEVDFAGLVVAQVGLDQALFVLRLGPDFLLEHVLGEHLLSHVKYFLLLESYFLGRYILASHVAVAQELLSPYRVVVDVLHSDALPYFFGAALESPLQAQVLRLNLIFEDHFCLLALILDLLEFFLVLLIQVVQTSVKLQDLLVLQLLVQEDVSSGHAFHMEC